MSLEVTVRGLEKDEWPANPFIKKGYQLVDCYEVNKELLLNEFNFKAQVYSFFTVNGESVYGRDHHKVQGFKVINGETLLKAIHKDNAIPKGNYYRRNGKIAFGGLNHIDRYDLMNSVNVYGETYCIISRSYFNPFSSSPLVVTSYYSLEGKRYNSVDQIISKHPVMVKLSKIGLLDEGKRAYDMLDSFLTSCSVGYHAKYLVMETLNRSIERLISDNKKDKKAQRLALSETFSTLERMIKKHPEKFLEGLKVMQG